MTIITLLILLVTQSNAHAPTFGTFENNMGSQEITQPVQEDAIRIFGVNSGSVTYITTGANTGSQTLYFEDYGLKTANFQKKETLSHTSMEGEITNKEVNEDEREEIEIHIDGYIYTINPLTKEGKKRDDNYLRACRAANVEPSKYGEYIMSLGGMLELSDRTEIILDKECRVWASNEETMELFGLNMHIYEWKNVILKSEISGDGGISMIATEIQTDIDIPDGLFQIPEGIIIEVEE